MNLRNLPSPEELSGSERGRTNCVGALLRSGLGGQRGRPPYLVDDDGDVRCSVLYEPLPTRYAPAVAHDPEDVATALKLLRKRYSPLGYTIAEDQGLAFPDAARSPYYFPIISRSRSGAAGTITLGVDSPGGLLVDSAHKQDADAIRSQGRRLCELVRFALQEDVDSKTVLASLFQCVYRICSSVFDLTDVLIEVVPRHVPFYSRVFGFVPLTHKKACVRAGGAELVLLRLRREDLERRLFGDGWNS